MNSTQLRPADSKRPLVAVICSVPLLGEAVGSAVEFAEVRAFSGRGDDLVGLLRWLHPDAVIVDSQAGVDQAVAYAREHDLPVLHISVRDRTLRLFRHGAWEEVGNGEGPTPESVRNVVAGALFAREVSGG
jgi:hypothetical protein